MAKAEEMQQEKDKKIGVSTRPRYLG